MKNIENYLPDLNKEHEPDKILDDISIYRDEYGIPHIKAKNSYDAFFGQGFATAQDRMWQMEYDRKRAYGKLSELVGVSGLDNDEFMGSLNIISNVKDDFDQLDKSAKEMYVAYSDGVNAYLNSKDTLPIEFDLINLTIDSWQPWDCLAVFKVRHIMMGVFEGKIWRSSLLKEFQIDKLVNLFRGYEKNNLVIVPPQKLFDSEELDATEYFAKALEYIDDLSEIDIGSNSWVIGGEHTLSGKPMIAGDPHRGLDTPSVYYQNHISCDEFDVIGLSFPGCPGFPHFGHNKNVAWCVTHAGSDYQDLYIEKIRNIDGIMQYQYEGQWAPLIQDVYNVSILNGKTVKICSYKTRNGYILSFNDDNTKAISFRYSATYEFNTGFNVIRQMIDSQNSDQMENNMNDWVDPCNNFIFADTNGDYGYINRGKVPLRDQLNAWVPVPGWDKKYDWNGYVPFDELPRIRNPRNGFIVTANNKIPDEDYPFYLSLDSAPEYRARRITNRIKSHLKKGKFDSTSMLAIHSEIISIPAQILTKEIKKINFENPSYGELQKYLIDWDGSMDRNYVAPTIYSEFRYRLNKKIISGLLNSDKADKMLNAGGRGAPAHLRTLSARFISYIDRNNTEYLPNGYENWTSLFEKIFMESCDYLIDTYGNDRDLWKWGNVHKTNPVHTLSDLFPELSDQLNPPKFSVSGDGDTPHNAGYSNVSRYNVVATSVARYMFDVADWDNSKWIVPLGSSGHPGSKNYADQGYLWKDDKVIKMQYSWDVITKNYQLQILKKK